MTTLQKMFILLVGGYLLFKIVLGILFSVVMKRVGKKGNELKQRRMAIRQKQKTQSANIDDE